MLHRVRASGQFETGALLTTINEAVDRVAMHPVRVTLLQAQARAAEVPLWTVPIPATCSNEMYEQRLGQAVRRAVAEGFTQSILLLLRWVRTRENLLDAPLQLLDITTLPVS